MNSNKDISVTIDITPEEALYVYSLLKAQTSFDNSLYYSICKKLEYIIYGSYTVEELELYLGDVSSKLKDVHENG